MQMELDRTMALHKILYTIMADMDSYDKYCGWFLHDAQKDIIKNIMLLDLDKYSCFLCNYGYEHLKPLESPYDICQYCPVFNDECKCMDYTPYIRLRQIFIDHVRLVQNALIIPFSNEETEEISRCCSTISKLVPRFGTGA